VLRKNRADTCAEPTFVGSVGVGAGRLRAWVVATFSRRKSKCDCPNSARRAETRPARGWRQVSWKAI